MWINADLNIEKHSKGIEWFDITIVSQNLANKYRFTISKDKSPSLYALFDKIYREGKLYNE